MKEKNQAEWIYEVLGKKKDFLDISISNLTYAEREKIREKMLQYWEKKRRKKGFWGHL